MNTTKSPLHEKALTAGDIKLHDEIVIVNRFEVSYLHGKVVRITDQMVTIRLRDEDFGPNNFESFYMCTIGLLPYNGYWHSDKFVLYEEDSAEYIALIRDLRHTTATEKDCCGCRDCDDCCDEECSDRMCEER